jgi:hypothetical protein
LKNLISWQRKHRIITGVIVPLRIAMETRGYSANVAFCAAQLLTWSAKSLLTIPVFLLGGQTVGMVFLGTFFIAGVACAASPWFGYKVKPMRD